MVVLAAIGVLFGRDETGDVTALAAVQSLDETSELVDRLRGKLKRRLLVVAPRRHLVVHLIRREAIAGPQTDIDKVEGLYVSGRFEGALD